MSDSRWSAGIVTIAAALAALLFAATPSRADEKAFQIGGPTVSLAATSTTGKVQFQTSASSQNARIYNSATTPVFVACGDTNITASVAASMPINGPGTVIINCPQQYIAAISATTGTIYVTPGSGGGAQ